MNPEAEENLEPVAGLDGQVAAELVLPIYRKLIPGQVKARSIEFETGSR
jgi:hypothetical protein